MRSEVCLSSSRVEVPRPIIRLKFSFVCNICVNFVLEFQASESRLIQFAAVVKAVVSLLFNFPHTGLVGLNSSWHFSALTCIL
jgi:hypothetical protein